MPAQTKPIRATTANRKHYYVCIDCGAIGHAKAVMPGSRVTEILLWVIFFFPGPIYSAWRHMNHTLSCFKCGSTHLVSTDTAEGDALFHASLKSNLKEKY